MRFINFSLDEIQGTGIVDGNGGIRGISIADEQFPGTLDELIKANGPALSDAGRLLLDAPQINVEQIRYLPPLQTPSKIICVGLNYADHTDESPYDQPDYPTLFPRFTTSLVAHEAPIIRPNASDVLDFEGEMAAVIGKGGKHISKQDASDHVVGYSVFNEGSVRDYQFKTSSVDGWQEFRQHRWFRPASGDG